MIQGVQVHSLRQIPGERGKVIHMLRRDDPWCGTFGEIYFSVVYPGVVKGWHLHARMTLNYAVVSGMVKRQDMRSEDLTLKLSPKFYLQNMERPLVIDGRRVSDKRPFLAAGIIYKGIGL